MICYYAKLENDQIVEFPIYQGDLKNLVGFDDLSGEEFPTPEGYVAVEDTIPPAFPQDHTKTLREGTPVLVDNLWTRVWTIDEATESELQIRTQRKSTEVRKLRNEFLANSDWTQLADAPVDSGMWTVYRQQLRDVPSQSGFPWQIEWPVAP